MQTDLKREKKKKKTKQKQKTNQKTTTTKGIDFIRNLPPKFLYARKKKTTSNLTLTFPLSGDITDSAVQWA